MDIIDNNCRKIGHLEWNIVSCLGDLLPNIPEEQYSRDLKEVILDIQSKILFPAIELKDIQIYSANDRNKGFGRKALIEFTIEAQRQNFKHAIVRIGKHNPDDSLDGNTNFYTKCGWRRFITPNEFSLRFAYYIL